MPALAELVGQDDVDRLAALKASLREGERAAEAAVAVTPVQPVCPTCGARRQVPEAVFSDR